MADAAQRRIEQASIETANNIRAVAQSLAQAELSRLSLPEIDYVSDVIGRMLPAGNIPGLILSGLARLPGRKPPRDVLERDVDVLFEAVHQSLEKAVYSAFFAGPAAVIWGYQNLMKLAGKEASDAFPDGTWQFYVDYALREDTARHANETHGFDSVLAKHSIGLSRLDRMTALVMAAAHTLHDYDALLENEWRERTYTHLLWEIAQGSSLEKEAAQVYPRWSQQRPYMRGQDAESHESYAGYRKRKFDDFFESVMGALDADLRRRWLERARDSKANDLAAYQGQMSILAYLQPGAYHETHTPIPLHQAHIGVVVGGHYYFIPACVPNTARPVEVETIRSALATLLARPSDAPPAHLQTLARVQRAKLPNLLEALGEGLVRDLEMLRYAPVLINFDRADADLPLSHLRQAERGIGDHALTIFDTGESLVFDQSHIFFDGAWGAALAEIITNEALAWAVYLAQLPLPEPGAHRPYSPAFRIGQQDQRAISQTPCITPEVGAESSQINLGGLRALRRMFKQRSDLLQLTVNDLLVLYRAIHAVTYEPPAELTAHLRQLANHPSTARAAHQALETLADHSNPAILIPVDASQGSPRDRLYPMSFEVPLAELNLIEHHKRVMLALYRYDSAADERSSAWQQFNSAQREYLATLAGFGAVLSRAKDIAIHGESASVGSIKLLAHISPPLQRVLDQVPGRFDVLNDIIKGREVFSNVGAVAPTSTLTRFITAKDDNEKKTLAWGIITDAEGVMRVTLRDFRPHVARLQAAGHGDIAAHMAQDYLDTYVSGFNQYVQDLQRIARASRQTRVTNGH